MSKKEIKETDNKSAKAVNKQIKKDDLLTTGELAEASGVRYGTIKYYSQIKILPFEQAGKRLRKYYDKEEAAKRLNEIQILKSKRLTIEEIIRHFKSNKSHQGAIQGHTRPYKHYKTLHNLY